MPRSIAMNDRVAPRRQKAAAVAQKERGLIMQIMFHSPKDTLAGALALTAVLAIIGLVTPLIAAIAMSSSSIIVVLNALRLDLSRRRITS